MALPFLEPIKKGVGKIQEKTGVRINPWPVLILGCALLLISLIFMPSVVRFALSLALFLSPLWLPFLLISGAWALWVGLRQSLFIAKQTYVLLEIKPPRNVVKTPLAMEAVLDGLHQTGGEATWYKKYILGSMRASWSLEIVSLEGKVHFFVWMRSNFRRLFESSIYAQYPDVQITEAPDYTRLISGKTDEWSIWGCGYKHTGKDSYPIKTYVAYGLDKVQKEPEQVDPLANLIEFMGSLGKGENLWVQIVIRAHKGEKYHKKNKKGKPYTWKDEAEEIVEEIRKATREHYIDPTTGKEIPGFPNPTKGQAEKMAAIERNVSKQAFDVAIRSVYLAKPDKFVPATISGIISVFKQFSAEGWNGIKATSWMMRFDDYPWEIGVNRLKDKVRRALIEACRRRQAFQAPFSMYGPSADEHMVMSTEEIATLYHIPSLAVTAPSLARAQSATGEAPANLPV